MAKRQKNRLGRGLSSLVSQPGERSGSNNAMGAGDESPVGDTKERASAGEGAGKREGDEGRPRSNVGAGAGGTDGDGVGTVDDRRGTEGERRAGLSEAVSGISGGASTGAAGAAVEPEDASAGTPVGVVSGGTSVGTSGGAPGGVAGELAMVSVDRIVPNPFQPRREMDAGSLEELAASIREQGVLQPVIVRRDVSFADTGMYQLVAGERRWRAARLAGLVELPALVRSLGDRAAAELALIENVQREDLNVVDRALALRHLSERFGLTHETLAERVGMGRATVSNLLRLTELEPEVLELLSAGSLTLGHAKVMLTFPSGETRVRVAQQVASLGLSVRELEEALERSRRGDPSALGDSGSGGGGRRGGGTKREKPASVLDLERRLGESLGTGVRITTTNRDRTKGRIVVDFYDLDHFDQLLGRFGLASSL